MCTLQPPVYQRRGGLRLYAPQPVAANIQVDDDGDATNQRAKCALTYVPCSTSIQRN